MRFSLAVRLTATIGVWEAKRLYTSANTENSRPGSYTELAPPQELETPRFAVPCSSPTCWSQGTTRLAPDHSTNLLVIPKGMQTYMLHNYMYCRSVVRGTRARDPMGIFRQSGERVLPTSLGLARPHSAPQICATLSFGNYRTTDINSVVLVTVGAASRPSVCASEPSKAYMVTSANRQSRRSDVPHR